LTQQALAAGFKGIDTANQPKHYKEELVGEALQAAFNRGLQRQSLFIQSKFTSLNGQDHRLPYDPAADLKTQVQQSFESSLEHLGIDYLDSYVMHGPQSHPGLIDDDWQVWSAIEAIYKSEKTKCIGISNVNFQQLQKLVQEAEIKPMVLQNRCYARFGWDRQIREFCKTQGILYQGFSLLTANVPVLEHPIVREIAHQHQATIPQVIFCFAMQIGIIPLTGTTDKQHMKDDLQAMELKLSADEVAQLENLAG
jgi:diketogulonate reductase-like aldo/keto reductase